MIDSFNFIIDVYLAYYTVIYLFILIFNLYHPSFETIDSE